ncbi:MAG: NAD(P)-dependent oxidoreductase, partial [Streptosporangiaceae bacterium]
MSTEHPGAQSPPNLRRSWPPGYPVELAMAGRRAVVVGGGAVALRRARARAETGADVTVIAPEADDALAALPVTVLR